MWTTVQRDKPTKRQVGRLAPDSLCTVHCAGTVQGPCMECSFVVAWTVQGPCIDCPELNDQLANKKYLRTHLVEKEAIVVIL